MSEDENTKNCGQVREMGFFPQAREISILERQKKTSRKTDGEIEDVNKDVVRKHEMKRCGYFCMNMA